MLDTRVHIDVALLYNVESGKLSKQISLCCLLWLFSFVLIIFPAPPDTLLLQSEKRAIAGKSYECALVLSVNNFLLRFHVLLSLVVYRGRQESVIVTKL